MKNKPLTIAIICLLSLIVLLLIGIFIFLLNNKSEINYDKIFNIQKPKLTSTKTYKQSFNEISFEGNSEDLYFKASDDSTITIKTYGDNTKTKSYVENDKLIINSKTRSCHFMCFYNDKVVVYIPSNYDKKLNINEESGDIKINSFTSANINIKNSSGDINIKDLNEAVITSTSGDLDIGSSKKLDLASKSGDISILETSNLKLISTSGDITINKINNHLNIKSTSGDININNTNLTENSIIKSTSGDISIKNTNDIYIDAKTTSGDIKINKNNRKADIVLNISAKSGDVTVK